MGVVEEIKSFLRTSADVANKVDSVNTRSIARGASEQSFNFSALIDETIPLDRASALMRQTDRLYASWTQIYLSAVGCIDLNYIKNPKQFIAKYQPRFNLEAAEDEYECCDPELRDHLYGDSELFFAMESAGCTYLLVVAPGEKPSYALYASMESAREEHLAGYNLKGLSGRKTYSFMEAEAGDIVDAALDAAIRSGASAQLQDTSRIQGPRMSDSDVKKLNEMQPYVIELKLLASKGDSSFSQYITFSVGVKTIMHLGRQEVIAKNLVYVLRNKNPMFNFIRWTTGEISLMKDLILHLDDINFDIANKTDRTGKFIASLKKLKKKGVKAGVGFGINRLAPFATLAISSSTYEEVKNKYGYDLKNMTFAKKIMDELFLMSFIILDDITQTIDILVDGQYDFQTYSLEQLDREVNMNSSKLSKELLSMLGA